MEGFSTLPTNHPVTNTTHSFTTLNLSALLGAGRTQSPVFLAGPVWQDLGTLGYTNHSQVIITCNVGCILTSTVYFNICFLLHGIYIT